MKEFIKAPRRRIRFNHAWNAFISIPTSWDAHVTSSKAHIYEELRFKYLFCNKFVKLYRVLINAPTKTWSIL
jgi:hypothetical protein